MATKHTLGPWRDSGEYDSHAGYWDTTIVGDGEDVDESFVAIVRSGNGREQVRANARLIAAAPELLQSLLFYVTIYGNTGAMVDRQSANEAYNLAQAAIAKATGE